MRLDRSTAPADGPVQALVGGYLQPWSQPGAWTEAIRPMLDDGSLVLHLLLAEHWGGDRRDHQFPEAFRALVALPGVVEHGVSEYFDFRRLVSSCHIGVDVFARNPERELAMVTRTLVTLSCGVPALHVPFTETGLLMDRHRAGWTVDGDDPEGVARVLSQVSKNRTLLAEQRSRVERFGERLLRPDVATAGLSDLLQEIR